MSAARLAVSRERILAFRRRVGALDQRLPAGDEALRAAAWAGLQDSMPRAALSSIHARVEEAHPGSWEHPSLVQVWGPRFQDYVVPAQDVAVFTLARFPDDARGQRVATETADRLERFLAGRRMGYGIAGDEMRVPPNSLRYATTTGRVLIRWEGTRQPIVWTIPAPSITAVEARLELARRYLHVFGPATAEAFAKWAGIGRAQGPATFEALGAELMAVETPIGDGWILAADEALMRKPVGSGHADRTAPARLLPSGDTFFLLWGRDRELLVADPKRRDELWTSRVWPGALLVRGEVAGTWRRANANVSIQPWRGFSAAERDAIEAEAASLPLPGLPGAIRVRWE